MCRVVCKVSREGIKITRKIFLKFLFMRSVGFFSQAYLVFLMKESKKRR